MSEHDFLPIPDANDFNAAFELVDEAIAAQGGATVLAQGEATFSIADQTAMEWDMMLARYSTLLIPYGSNPNNPASYAPAHAFSRGFMMTTAVNDLVYDNRYTFPDYFLSMHDTMKRQGIDLIEDARQQFELSASLVRQYGEYGLRAVGGTSRNVIEKWAHSLYGDGALARICRLGGGAAVTAGVIHQTLINAAVQETFLGERK